MIDTLCKSLVIAILLMFLLCFSFEAGYFAQLGYMANHPHAFSMLTLKEHLDNSWGYVGVVTLISYAATGLFVFIALWVVLQALDKIIQKTGSKVSVIKKLSVAITAPKKEGSLATLLYALLVSQIILCGASWLFTKIYFSETELQWIRNSFMGSLNLYTKSIVLLLPFLTWLIYQERQMAIPQLAVSSCFAALPKYIFLSIALLAIPMSCLKGAVMAQHVVHAQPIERVAVHYNKEGLGIEVRGHIVARGQNVVILEANTRQLLAYPSSVVEPLFAR